MFPCFVITTREVGEAEKVTGRDLNLDLPHLKSRSQDITPSLYTQATIPPMSLLPVGKQNKQKTSRFIPFLEADLAKLRKMELVPRGSWWVTSLGKPPQMFASLNDALKLNVKNISKKHFHFIIY